jgi:hypothetical protein
MKKQRDFSPTPAVSIVGKSWLRIYPVGASPNLFNPFNQERYA